VPKSNQLVGAQAVLLVTNPLHYQYLLNDFWPESLYVVASKNGVAATSYDASAPRVVLVDGHTGLPELYEASHQLFPDTAKFFSWKTFAANTKPLGNSYEQVHDLENKVAVRSLLPAELFPDHVIVPADSRPKLTELQVTLRTPKIVVQAAVSTGGVGTFIVNDEVQYQEALQTNAVTNQELAISAFVAGQAYGLQCFFDGQRLIYPNYWHRDLVGIHGVYNEKSYTTKYCGAVIENTPTQFADQLQHIVTEVEKALQKNGYFGIIGLDLVVGDDGQIYLIELNPRFTAVSHVYATLFRAVGLSEDFMSAQLKGLLGEQIQEDFEQWPTLTNQYYYIKLQNTSNYDQVVLSECRLGTYDQQLVYKNARFGVDGLTSASDIVLIPEVKPDKVIVPGARHISIIGSGMPLDNSNQALNALTLHVVETVRQKFTAPA
jgi:hypothetical protein